MTPKELDNFLNDPTEGYFVKFSGLKTWWMKRTATDRQAIQNNWYNLFKSYEPFWLWNAAEALQRSGNTPINVQEAHRDALLSWIKDRMPPPRHPIMDVPEPTETQVQERVLKWEETYKILKEQNAALRPQKDDQDLERTTATAPKDLKRIPEKEIQDLKEDYEKLKGKEDVAF
jgi:hypothetical protein